MENFINEIDDLSDDELLNVMNELTATFTGGSYSYSTPSIWAKNKRNWRHGSIPIFNGGKIVKENIMNNKFVKVKKMQEGKCISEIKVSETLFKEMCDKMSKEEIDEYFNKVIDGDLLLGSDEMNEEIGINKKVLKNNKKEGDKASKELKNKLKPYIEPKENKDFTTKKRNIGLDSNVGKKVEKLEKELDNWDINNHGLGMLDLVYDTEPSKNFKERNKNLTLGKSPSGKESDHDGEDISGNQKHLDMATKRTKARDADLGYAGLGDFQTVIKGTKKYKKASDYTVNENKLVFSVSLRNDLTEDDIYQFMPEEFKIDNMSFELVDENLIYECKYEEYGKDGLVVIENIIDLYKENHTKELMNRMNKK